MPSEFRTHPPSLPPQARLSADRGTRRQPTRHRILAFSAAALLLPGASWGLDLTWDIQLALGGAQGGSGDWHDDNRWLVGASNLDWPNVSANSLDATFAGTAGSVSIEGRITGVDSITFATSGYRVIGTGGHLDANLSGGFIDVVVNSGVSASIEVLITDFEKLGTGTLTLTSDTQANIGVTAGTLIMDGNTASSALVGAAGTLVIDNTVQFTGNVQGSGNMTVNGVLDSIVAFSGDITGNRLNLRGGSLSGTNTVDQMAFVAATTTLASATSIDSSTLVIVSGGSMALGADVSIGTLQPGTSTVGTINLGTHTLSVQAGSSPNVINGTGGLRKLGAGDLTLSGNSTFTGLFDVVAGTVSLAKLANTGVASPLGSGSTIRLGNGAGNGTLEYTGATVATNRALTLVGTATNTGGAIEVTNAASTVTWNGAISGAGPLRKVGAGTLVLNGPNSLSGEVRVQGGILQITANDSFDTVGRVVLSNAAGVALELQADAVIGGLSGGGVTGGNLLLDTSELSVNQATDEIFAGVISGSGAFSKTGAGQLTLSRANTWTGPISISGGALRLAHLDAVSTAGTVTVNSGGQLALDVDAAINGLSGGGSVALGTRALTITQPGNTTFNGFITGTGTATTLTKRGAGTLTLTNGTSSYTQPVRIEDGTLSIGAISNAGNSSPLGAGSAITLGSANSLGTLRFTGGTVLTDRAFTMAAGGGNVDVTLAAGRLATDGIISGPGALTKKGAGTFGANNGNSTFSGALVIENGAWEAATWRNAGTASSVGTGGAITLGVAASASVATLRYTGTTGASNRALTVPGAGEVELTSAATTFTLNAGLNGTGSLVRKDGPGRLVLASAGTFTGAFSLLSGPLQLAHINALANVSGITLSNSAGTNLELADVASGSYILPNLSGNAPAGFGLALGAESATFLQTVPTTFLAPISGTGTNATLTKAGPGILTLTGASTFSQTLRIADGAISVAVMNAPANPGPLGATPSIVLGAGATRGTLRFTGGSGATNSRLISIPAGEGGGIEVTNSAFNQTGALIGSGPLLKTGVGTLTLSIGNTYSGVATIEGGVLALNHPTALAQASLVTVGSTGLLSLSTDSTLNAIDGNGVVALNTNALTLTGNANATLGSLVAGTDGTKTLTKRGNGTLTLTNFGNSFTQSIAIEDGAISTISLRSAGTLSPLGTGTTISLGALGTQGALVFTGPTQLSDRPFTLNLGGGVVEVASATTTLTLSGEFSGPGALVKNGAGRVALQGANSFTGDVLIQGGELVIGSIANAGVVGNLGAGDLIGLAEGARLTFLGVEGAAGAMDREIFLNGGGTIATAADLTLTGGLSGTIGNGLEKRGAARLILDGTHSFPSAYSVIEGELQVLGTIGSGSAVNVTGGRLSGTGTVARAVNITGFSSTLAPGAPTGALTTGALTISAGTFHLQLDSAASFSRLNVTGGVTLANNAQLSLSLAPGFDPVDFLDTFAIVQNDGTDPISGRFFLGANQLAEGEEFFAVSQAWQISYAAGDGNDIVLAAVPEPSALTALTAALLLVPSRRLRRARTSKTD